MKEKIIASIILAALIAIIFGSVSLSRTMNYNNKIIVGNLSGDNKFDNGKMYRLRMKDGSTYIAPYTSITLIND